MFAKLQPLISNMVSMDLSSTSVTDASVARLERAGYSHMIRLFRTGVTDSSNDSLDMEIITGA